MRLRTTVAMAAAFVVSVWGGRARGQTTQPAVPQPAPTTGLWRQQIFAGNWTFAWNTAGLQLPVGAMAWDRVPCPDSTDHSFSRGLSFPTPGTYVIAGVGTVTVVPAPAPRKVVNIQPSGGDDSGAIQAALNAGNDVALSGSYTLAHAVTMPNGSTISGGTAGGTVVGRIADGDYANRMFVPGANCTLADMTLRPLSYAVHNNNGGTNLNLMRLVVTDGVLGEWGGGGAYVVDCQFVRTSTFANSHTLWFRDTFSGIAGNNNSAWVCKDGSTVAMIACTFDGTDRGPVFQCPNGFSDAFVVGLNLRNIDQVNGGCEWFLTEIGTVNRVYLRRTRINGCVGWLMLSGTTASDWYVDDMAWSAGSGGVVVNDGFTNKVARILFNRLDVEGGTFCLGSTAQAQVTNFIWHRPEWRRGGNFNWLAARGPAPAFTVRTGGVLSISNGIVVGGTISSGAVSMGVDSSWNPTVVSK